MLRTERGVEMRKKLLDIQGALKAPKGQYNSFGKYYYRSCEDILTAVKPLCAEYGAVLTVSDEIIQIGDRFYVKATAMLKDVDSSEALYVSAYARESEAKAGMDASQITGSASSYARKYALNGLFCIDDTKDADALPPSEDKTESKTTTKEQQAWKKENGKTYIKNSNGEYCELGRYSMKSLQKIVSDDKYKAIKWDIAKAIKEKQANE